MKEKELPIPNVKEDQVPIEETRQENLSLSIAKGFLSIKGFIFVILRYSFFFEKSKIVNQN